jgi:hypothetical protein
MRDITSRLEINCNDPMIPLPVVAERASKASAAAVIIHDVNLLPPLYQTKMSSGGRWKIILAVDFPFGEKWVLDKFKTIGSIDLEAVDGFEIMLSQKKFNNQDLTEIDTLNEIQIITDFIRQMGNGLEVRFCIDYFSRSTALIENACKAFKRSAPVLIRLDQHLDKPGVGISTITKAIEHIRRFTPAPIKVSPNITAALEDEGITLLDAITELEQDVARFDVTVVQLDSIIDDLTAPVSEQVEEVEKPTEKSETETKSGTDDQTAETAEKTAERSGSLAVVKKGPDQASLEVQRSMHVHPRILESGNNAFTPPPKNTVKQSGSSVTPPPKNPQRQ